MQKYVAIRRVRCGDVFKVETNSLQLETQCQRPVRFGVAIPANVAKRRKFPERHDDSLVAYVAEMPDFIGVADALDDGVGKPVVGVGNDCDSHGVRSFQRRDWQRISLRIRSVSPENGNDFSINFVPKHEQWRGFY